MCFYVLTLNSSFTSNLFLSYLTRFHHLSASAPSLLPHKSSEHRLLYHPVLLFSPTTFFLNFSQPFFFLVLTLFSPVSVTLSLPPPLSFLSVLLLSLILLF